MTSTPTVASVVVLVPAWRLDRPFDYLVPGGLIDRVKVGTLVRVPFGSRKVRGVVIGLGSTSDVEDLGEIKAVVIDEPVCPAPLIELARAIAIRYGVPLSRAVERFVPARVRVQVPEPIPPSSFGGSSRLSAYDGGDALMKAIESGDQGTWGLHVRPCEDRGELIADLVARVPPGRGVALVAVPEVHYGSEVLDAVQSRFPGLQRVDSARDPGERAVAWVGAAAGLGPVGGGRSVVLAPAPSVRLIVVDEAHQPTYKEDRAPRYDARWVAQTRAQLQGAVCVVVSLAPAVEAGAAAAAGRIGWVSAGRAAFKADRPIVEVVDVPPDRALSRALHRRVSDTLGRSERVALLVPRPGFSSALWCKACRRSLRCPECETALGFESAPGTTRRRVRCSRCGFTAEPPDRCPQCEASDWRYIGSGSERLTDQIAKMFPRSRVRRMDPDVLATGADASDADIYVTTWVGTKPAIRPDVSLVGVIDADALIRRQGFRAAETAYQALVEMSAWAGPATSGGRLLIQSSDARHHAIQAVVRADYEFFLERELAHRSELFYPPFAELIKVTASGAKADRAMTQVVDVCRTEGARVLGPIRRSTERGPEIELLVKASDASAIGGALRGILAAATAEGRLKIDADPR